MWHKQGGKNGPVVGHFQDSPSLTYDPKFLWPPNPRIGDMIFQSFVTQNRQKSTFAPANHIVGGGKKVIEIGRCLHKGYWRCWKKISEKF